MRWVGKPLPDFFRRVAQFSAENRRSLLSTLSYLRPVRRTRCVLLTIGHLVKAAQLKMALIDGELRTRLYAPTAPWLRCFRLRSSAVRTLSMTTANNPAASSAVVRQSRERIGKKAVSLLPTFMYFRSSTRRRFPLQFDLIVINGGPDEIL
jgi:hypothetical protein